MKSNIIDPKTLAKRTKESAKTVSLRIKEKTWIGFEQLAKENDTTANALIAELADYYIENINSNLDLSDATVKKARIVEALEKEVRRMCRLTIDEIMSDSDLCDGSCYAGDVNEPLCYLEYCRKYAPVDESGKILWDYRYSLQSGLGKLTIYPTFDNKTTYQPGVWDPHSCLENMLLVEFEKTPDVIHILNFAYKLFADNKINLNLNDVDLMDSSASTINRWGYDYDNSSKTNPTYNELNRKNMLTGIIDDIMTELEKE